MLHTSDGAVFNITCTAFGHSELCGAMSPRRALFYLFLSFGHMITLLVHVPELPVMHGPPISSYPSGKHSDSMQVMR